MKSKKELEEMFGGRYEEMLKEAEKSKKDNNESKKETVEVIKSNENINSLSKLKEKLEPLFPDIWEEIKICLSVYSTLLLKNLNGCVSLILVGPPSSQKTTALSLFYGFNLSQVEDNFSPRGFVSHSSAFSEKQLREEIDLLPKLKNKCLLSPELAPIFECNKDKLIDNFSILTRVLDGEGLSTHTGAKGTRSYQGDYCFTWLGATTPLRHSVWKLMGKLGNRLFFWQINKKEKSDEELTSMFLNPEREYSDRVKIGRGYVHSFLKNLFDNDNRRSLEWDRDKDKFVFPIIVRYARLLTLLRGTLMIWKGNEDKKYEYSIPVIEEPPRAISALYNFARGHAIVNGRKYLLEEDLEIVKKIALSSMPHDRRKVLEIMLKHDGRASTSVISEELNTSSDTASRTMKIFSILGVADKKSIQIDTGESGRPEHYIELKPKFKELLVNRGSKNNEINILNSEKNTSPPKDEEYKVEHEYVA